MTIKLAVKQVYGKPLIYCLDKQQAEILERLTGKKTLDRKDIECLLALGLSVNLQDSFNQI